MFTNNKLAKSVRLAIAFGAASTALPATQAFAQEEGAQEVERIAVTGSRIKRADLESASPVTITSAEDIKLSGFTKIEDLLNGLPQVEASQTSFISNGASGTASLDLRGMGTARTLVLVNGRRMGPGGLNSQSADINQIPSALVKRVEIMTGGGSSVYGADAVAGVVNFVMDEDFEGVEITAGASGYQHNNDNSYIQGLMDERGFEYPEGSSGIDGKQFNFDITMGGEFADGKGHAVAYATWREVEELRQEARDYSSCALNSAGTACGGSGNAIIPNFYMGVPQTDGSVDWNGFGDYWTLTPDSGFQASSGNVYNYAPVNHFMRPDTKYSLGAFVDYEISDFARPYMEVSFMNDVTKAQIAESGTFFNEAYLIDYDSDLLTDAHRAFLTSELGLGTGDQFATYIGKRNVEGGPRASNLEHSSFRIVVGSEGDINDNWVYDASFQFASVSSSSVYVNDFFAPRITTALDANGESCADTSGCVPYEVFTYQGVTSEQASTLTGTGIRKGYAEESIFNAFVSGEFDFTLPTADTPVAAVFGVEHREQYFESISDEVFEKGLLLGQGGPTDTLVGGYRVSELFTELSLPILEGAPLAEMLTLDLGFRYSDYSTSGGESTYKAQIDWTVVEGIKVRGGYNRSVRAPNVAELFSNQSLGLWGGADPCANDTTTGVPALTAAQCANTGVSSSQYGNIAASPASQYNGLFGGNPDLSPEIADTITLGVVANITDDLNFTVDYWDIELDQAIGSIDAELTVEQCALTGSASFCDNITRNSAGSLWVGQQGFVQATQINLGGVHFEGVDISSNYQMDIGDGKFTANINGTYMLAKEFDPGIEGSAYDCVDTINTQCFAQPEWRHNMKLAYASDSFWTVSANWRYFGAVSYDGETDTLLVEDGGIKAQSYFDLKGAFEINEFTGVLVGVNNILDEEPPMVGGTLSSNANAIAGYYDTLGRYLHASVTFKF